MTTWQPRLRAPSTQRTWTVTCECAVLFVSQVLVVIDSHCTAWLKVLRMSSHPRMWWAFLDHLESSILFILLIFPFIFYLLHFLPHFFHFLEGRSELVHSAKKGMDSLDNSYSLTGYEPNAYDFNETYVESYTESLTAPQFSEQGFLEDVEYDDTALEDMLREVHRVHVYHSQREGLKSNLKRPGLNTIIYKSQIMSTLRKS